MSDQQLHLRIAGVHNARLRAELFLGDGKEAVAFALCGRHQGDDRELLLVQEVFPIPHNAYRERLPNRVTWRTDFLPPLLERADAKGLSILKIHSHPGGLRDFSAVDDHADRELFPSLHAWIDVGLHASAVMLPDGSVVARAVADDGTFQRFDRVTIVGHQLQIFDRGDREPADLPPHAARHAMALGDATSLRLRSLRVGVIGCSGTGSFVLEQLARLGVADILAIDPDSIEDVNVNRILNSTVDDARAGLAKVKLAARSSASMGLGGKVRPLEIDVGQREAVLALAACDVVFGCVDSHEGRRVLNRIATFYLIPYIDVGVRIDAENGCISHISGAVHYLQPGRSSLLSRGVINHPKADAEALRRAHPDVYRERLGEGYIRGVAEVPRPAVISINGIFASLAVTELLARLHGFRENDDGVAEQRLCITDSYCSTMAEGAPCPVLLPHVGRGDVSPLLDRPSLGSL